LIRLLLDMGLPRRAAEDLRREGLDIVHVGEVGMAPAPDREILAFAEREHFTVITLDSDFAKILVTEGRSAPALIHLRLPDLDRQATVQLLRDILPLLIDDLEKGCIASVGPLGIRVRTLPVLRG
jgi:predicted nuclease of predicted toxin-antitoxin system